MPPVTPAAPLATRPGAEQELRKHINGVCERLSQEFRPRVDPEVVSREVEIAAAQFSGAKVTTYVPVLINRQVRLKLRELVSAA